MMNGNARGGKERKGASPLTYPMNLGLNLTSPLAFPGIQKGNKK